MDVELNFVESVMKSSNKNQDKTYKRAIDIHEWTTDLKPSKAQKKQKTKMRQNGKKIIRKELKENG